MFTRFVVHNMLSCEPTPATVSNSTRMTAFALARALSRHSRVSCLNNCCNSSRASNVSEFGIGRCRSPALRLIPVMYITLASQLANSVARTIHLALRLMVHNELPSVPAISFFTTMQFIRKMYERLHSSATTSPRRSCKVNFRLRPPGLAPVSHSLSHGPDMADPVTVEHNLNFSKSLDVCSLF